jgi:hypothetical protein
MKRIHLLQGGSALLLTGCAGATLGQGNAMLPTSLHPALQPHACAGGRILVHGDFLIFEKWAPSGHGGCLDTKVVATSSIKPLHNPDTVEFALTQTDDGQEFKLKMDAAGITEQKFIKFFKWWLRRIEKQKVVIYGPGPGKPLMEVSTNLSEPDELTFTATDMTIKKTFVRSVNLRKKLDPDDECTAAALNFAACLAACVLLWATAETVVTIGFAMIASVALASAAVTMNDECPQ